MTLSKKNAAYDADEQTGFIYAAAYESSYEDLITIDGAEDLDAADATVIDVTDDTSYDSIADLDAAVKDGKDVYVSVYANEGAVLIVVVPAPTK